MAKCLRDVRYNLVYIKARREGKGGGAAGSAAEIPLKFTKESKIELVDVS